MWDLEALRLGDLPGEGARRWGDREALTFDGRRWTFGEFATEVDRCAKGLIALGIEPGERVAVWMTNLPEWLFLMYGLAKVGAVNVPLNTRYRADDLAYAVAQSRSAMLVALARSGPVDYAAMLGEAMPDLGAGQPGALRLPGFPELRTLVMLGGNDLPNATPWPALLAAGEAVADAALAARAAAVEPDDTMVILYTSGTTGDPKGVVHSHRPIRATCERAQLLEMDGRDTHMHYVPAFHLYGYSEVAMISALSGARQVLTDTFDAGRALDLAEAEGATILHGFDAHWHDLLAAQSARPRSLTLRFSTYPAGTESSSVIASRIRAAFGPTISGWGMSETWSFVTCSRLTDSDEQRANASGAPMPDYELRITDPATGAECPTDVPGELFVRGYSQMQGYYDKPEETAAALDAEGWMHTGDMARFRPDGQLVFMGRYKDMLKVGGENVSPAEIEARLMALDGVREAAVVGAPDARLQEVAVAFVVEDPGAGLDEESVIGRCLGRIASFKVPRRVFFVESLPSTSSGKVRKVELRGRLRALMAGKREKGGTG